MWYKKPRKRACNPIWVGPEADGIGLYQREWTLDFRMKPALKSETPKRRNGRPISGPKSKSEAVRVRLDEDEKNAFTRLADKLGVKPSILHRRLIKEAVDEGPEVFEKELAALLDTNVQLSAIGRNINQIARAINQGAIVVEPIVASDLEGVLSAVDAQKTAVRRMIKRARSKCKIRKSKRET